ncbi:MAG: ABC transporter substrate-binding protein [Oscillospiraceae bacterium]|nr:ABC transporter substrate-binding protein [Oscillospiraceae bacterium]
MKKAKQYAALIVALVMVFTLFVGNGTAFAAGNVLDNGRLEKFTIGMANDPQELAPWNPNNQGKNLVWHQIYECLFDNDGAEYVPILAKGYTVVDPTTVDVEIYDYIQDSEGNPVTADDVVYSYQVLVDSGYAIKYGIYDSIEKTGDYTVRFHFKEDPFVAIGSLEFIWGGTAIFTKAAYEAGNFAIAPVGTGPYKVASYQSGSKLVLEANENYWQTDELTADTHKRTVQTVEYDIITEAASQTVALNTGSIEYSNSFDMASLADFEANPNYTVKQSDGNFVYSLLANCYEGGLMANEDLRKAVYYAIDNTMIAAAVTGYNPAYGAGTNIFADYDPAWETEENYMTVYDVDLAKEYAAKAGYNGEEITIIAMNDEDIKNMATICKALLDMAGFNVTLNIGDLNSIQTISNQNTGWDLYLMYCASGGFCISLSQAFFDDTINGDDMTLGNFTDEELRAAYNLCNTMEGNNKENMDKLREIWIGKGYLDPLVVNVNYSIYSNALTEPCYDNNLNFVPGGSTYAGQ